MVNNWNRSAMFSHSPHQRQSQPGLKSLTAVPNPANSRLSGSRPKKPPLCSWQRFHQQLWVFFWSLLLRSHHLFPRLNNRIPLKGFLACHGVIDQWQGVGFTKFDAFAGQFNFAGEPRGVNLLVT